MRTVTTVNFQVENFQLVGELRRTKTEVRNSLPTQKTIQTEQILDWFDETRRKTPDSADYETFYRKLLDNMGTQNSLECIRVPHTHLVGTATGPPSGQDAWRGSNSRQSSGADSLATVPPTPRRLLNDKG
ncbi:hypothetical protein PoB_006128800 [Plakobranchus ocellatus]|uniref:Uncharacterized protein n=1 Tax=Plakobranchus ocellatus TaxID=259542 RepID=A0AAV4CS89_9GAST|nr:hypothetical protein PoB_006128800 [Plakobranchus ocellatus]